MPEFSVRLPRLRGAPFEQIRAAVRWYDDEFAITRLGFTKVLRMWSFTPEHLVRTKQVTSTFGCLDKATVIGFALLANDLDVDLIIEKVTLKKSPIGLHFRLNAAKKRERYCIDARVLKTTVGEGWGRDYYRGNLLLPVKGTKEVEFRIVAKRQLRLTGYDVPLSTITGISGWPEYFRRVGLSCVRYWPFYVARFGSTVHRRVSKLHKKRAMR